MRKLLNGYKEAAEQGDNQGAREALSNLTQIMKEGFSLFSGKSILQQDFGDAANEELKRALGIYNFIRENGLAAEATSVDHDAIKARPGSTDGR